MTHSTNSPKQPFWKNPMTHDLLLTGQLSAAICAITQHKALELHSSTDEDDFEHVHASIAKINGILENALDEIFKKI